MLDMGFEPEIAKILAEASQACSTLTRIQGFPMIRVPYIEYYITYGILSAPFFIESLCIQPCSDMSLWSYIHWQPAANFLVAGLPTSQEHGSVYLLLIRQAFHDSKTYSAYKHCSVPYFCTSPDSQQQGHVGWKGPILALLFVARVSLGGLFGMNI